MVVMKCPNCKTEITSLWQVKIEKINNNPITYQQTLRGRCFNCTKLYEGKRLIEYSRCFLIEKVEENDL